MSTRTAKLPDNLTNQILKCPNLIVAPNNINCFIRVMSIAIIVVFYTFISLIKKNCNPCILNINTVIWSGF